MSGSPIIQDGRLVGAVTYVFVDDPTMGYGFLPKVCLKMRNQRQTACKTGMVKKLS